MLGEHGSIVGIYADSSTQWFPRLNDESCRRYDCVRVSYCDHGDIYCDHGIDPLVHSSYFKNYFEHCMNFMIKKIEGVNP